MVQWAREKNKIKNMKSHKPLGELYSGGPERSVEAELEARPEEITEKAKELRQYIETGRKRVYELYETLQECTEELRLIQDKITEMPLQMRLAAENSGLDLEKTVEEFTRLQKLSEEIKQKTEKMLVTITGYEEKIKELEIKLEQEAWKDPRNGQA